MSSNDLISKRLRNLLTDHLVSQSTLREIEREFEAVDIIPIPNDSELNVGQRRALIQTYYNGMNFSDARDVRKFLNVLSVFLENIERSIPPSYAWSGATGKNQTKKKS